MWIILKYKKKQINHLLDSFKKILGEEIKFYNPKIKYQKYFRGKFKTFSKEILENYLICYHPSFKQEEKISSLKYIKGLEYFLTGCRQNQKEIKDFVNRCKENENSEGFLTQDFFQILKSKEAKFFTGPFTNMIFKIIRVIFRDFLLN